MYEKTKDNGDKIFATIETYDENIFEVAICTDTIHFENDTIKYKEFKTETEAKNYITKQLLKF